MCASQDVVARHSHKDDGIFVRFEPSTSVRHLFLFGVPRFTVLNINSIRQILEHHLGNSFMEKEEIDQKTVIRANWKKLIKQVKLSLNRLRSKNGLCLGTETNIQANKLPP